MGEIRKSSEEAMTVSIRNRLRACKVLTLEIQEDGCGT